ncbi:hypothetical protein OC842_002978 [Tilletia horrida]|uniref:Peptidase M20 dimerisation domain-containing protein n=1 Tax=Tilletia horrida TaxID=155126 RepID=A0AAN6JKU4_9BASI|nr:hypothetical protein OC842_002978 [Tilletia horrida]
MVLADDLVYLEKGDWPRHRELKHRANRAARCAALDRKHSRRQCTPLCVKLLGWAFLITSIGLLFISIAHPRALEDLHAAAGEHASDLWDDLTSAFSGADDLTEPDLCPQQPALKLKESTFTFNEPSLELQASRLSGAVQVDTSVQDEYPPFDENPQLWKGLFDPLADYFERTFPLTHAHDSPVTREKVGGVGLLYTWPGSDKSLKPLILAAHQDVVPVDPQTVDQWIHPPFSGFFDEKTGLVWGRGASDDKSNLVAVLTAVESLLAARDADGNPWVPKRTIVLSFGADEEASGRVAGDLAKHLVDVYGHKGAFMLVDEGGPVIAAEESPFKRTLAVVATAEKGYLDARITVHAPGGHSSMPPDHTAIGHLSSLITLIEKRPYTTHLNTENPAFTMLTCLATSDGVDAKLKQAVKELRKALRKQAKSARDKRRVERLKRKVLELSPTEIAESFGTSQAVDLISGGVKVNALPEEATAVINHRIDTDSSVADIRERIAATLLPYAREHNIELDAWGNSTLSFKPKHKDAKPSFEGEQEQMVMVAPSFQSAMHTKRSTWSYLRNTTNPAAAMQRASSSKKGTAALRIVLSDAFDSALEPAPPTPLQGEGSEPWELLQGVIRGAYEDIVVVPDLMGGNTDTKSYWNLTDAIFRFSPGSPDPTPGGLEDGIHTVNEFTAADGLVWGWRLWIKLIRAVAE